MHLSIPDISGSPWIHSLISSCLSDWGSHDHCVTYVALETLLKLLHTQPAHNDGFPNDSFPGQSVTTALIFQPLKSYFANNQSFLKVRRCDVCTYMPPPPSPTTRDPPIFGPSLKLNFIPKFWGERSYGVVS